MLVRVWDLGSGEVRTLGRVEGETAYLAFEDDRSLVWSGNNFFSDGPGGGEKVFDLETGSVEVVAEGGDADLAELEARLREGPSFSSVAGVERVAIEAPGHRGFEIR